MSVLIATSKGNFVVDLYYERCPRNCLNFIALCKAKYYNNCTFFNVQKDFALQTGDPSGTGKTGSSIFELIEHRVNMNTSKRIFVEDELHDDLMHNRPGLLSMANLNIPHTNSSQFFITTSTRHVDYLDGKHTIFGEIAEGLDTTIKRINNTYVNESYAPLSTIRILHTVVLIDPFEQDKTLGDFYAKLQRLVPEKSPAPILDGYDSEEEKIKASKQSHEQEEEALKQKEVHSRKVVLEILGDLPDIDAKPPDNVLFVCKLNPITSDKSLNILFSRFGKVLSCEIIRDKKTGDSMCYGFVEFDNPQSCEDAFLKMENVVVDDRRIHVDFSQSVAKLWKRYSTQGKHQERHNYDSDDNQQQHKPKKHQHHNSKHSNNYKNKKYNNNDDNLVFKSNSGIPMSSSAPQQDYKSSSSSSRHRHSHHHSRRYSKSPTRESSSRSSSRRSRRSRSRSEDSDYHRHRSSKQRRSRSRSPPRKG